MYMIISDVAHPYKTILEKNVSSVSKQEPEQNEEERL